MTLHPSYQAIHCFRVRTNPTCNVEVTVWCEVSSSIYFSVYGKIIILKAGLCKCSHESKRENCVANCLLGLHRSLWQWLIKPCARVLSWRFLWLSSPAGHGTEPCYWVHGPCPESGHRPCTLLGTASVLFSSQVNSVLFCPPSEPLVRPGSWTCQEKARGYWLVPRSYHLLTWVDPCCSGTLMNTECL